MNDLVAGKTGDWEVVIGLEVHIGNERNCFLVHQQVLVLHRMKMYHFDGCAMPGMLPVINRECVSGVSALASG